MTVPTIGQNQILGTIEKTESVRRARRHFVLGSIRIVNQTRLGI
jgi:hypothetical protein